MASDTCDWTMVVWWRRWCAISTRPRFANAGVDEPLARAALRVTQARPSRASSLARPPLIDHQKKIIDIDNAIAAGRGDVGLTTSAAAIPPAVDDCEQVIHADLAISAGRSDVRGAR